MMGTISSAGRAILAAAALVVAARAEFKVIGYLPNWNTGFQNIQWKKLTHVMWSFGIPANDGSLSGLQGARLSQVVALAHADKVKVFLALGGGGNGDDGFATATATEAGRQALAKACMDAVRTYGLDGIDFDWEYPDGAAQVANFNAMVKLLAGQLHAEGKQISAAVTYNDWPRSFPTGELFSHFDFLNIMIYDNPPPHSTVAHAQTSLDIWIRTKGLPREKFMLGCPFYGPGGRYNAIVAANPAAAWLDQNGAEGHNSIPTLRKKTELALQRAGGIMFWELSQDATGELSLLSAVHEVVLRHTATGILTLRPAAARPPYAMLWTGKGRFDLNGRARDEVRLRIPGL